MFAPLKIAVTEIAPPFQYSINSGTVQKQSELKQGHRNDSEIMSHASCISRYCKSVKTYSLSSNHGLVRSRLVTLCHNKVFLRDYHQHLVRLSSMFPVC